MRKWLFLTALALPLGLLVAQAQDPGKDKPSAAAKGPAAAKTTGAPKVAAAVPKTQAPHGARPQQARSRGKRPAPPVQGDLPG
jgi:hypothetical protein